MGFMDFGVNSVDKVGSESSVLLIQGVDDKCTRLIDVVEFGVDSVKRCGGWFYLGMLKAQMITM